MAKQPVITDVDSGYASNTLLNTNFDNVQTSFDNTLSLDGSTPNSMGADLDMNSNDILNANLVAATDITVAGVSLATQVAAAAASAVAADASATAADASATAAAASATTAASITEFLNLTDVPASYTGQALQTVRVNAGETALEFASGSATVGDADYGDITVASSGAVWTIDNGAVDAAALATDAVTTIKILDDAVTTGKIVNDAVTLAKIAAAAKSGADATLVTGTAGTLNYTAKWNTDGDLVDGFEVLDEDTMVTDSATKLATQQSIKAYVDTNSGGFTRETAIATTSGADHTWSSIPAGVNQIVMMLDLVGLNTVGPEMLVRMGDSGGIETSGYRSSAEHNGTYVSSTVGFLLTPVGDAAAEYSGTITFNRLDGNLWEATGMLNKASTAFTFVCGSKTLTGELTSIQLANNGAGTFDTGSANIMYK